MTGWRLRDQEAGATSIRWATRLQVLRIELETAELLRMRLILGHWEYGRWSLETYRRRFGHYPGD